MGNRRWISMTMVVATALPWSVALGILGLWILFDSHGLGVLSNRGIAVPVGLCSLAGAQLVFLMCIADRVFPRVPVSLNRSVESVFGAILVIMTIVLCVNMVPI